MYLVKWYRYRECTSWSSNYSNNEFPSTFWQVKKNQFLNKNLSRVVSTQYRRCSAIPSRKNPINVYQNGHLNTKERNHAPSMVRIQSAMATPKKWVCIPFPGIPKASLYWQSIYYISRTYGSAPPLKLPASPG